MAQKGGEHIRGRRGEAKPSKVRGVVQRGEMDGGPIGAAEELECGRVRNPVSPARNHVESFGMPDMSGHPVGLLRRSNKRR